MRKNIIVIVLSLFLIATTTLLASSRPTIPSSYETTVGFQTSSQKEIPIPQVDQQTKTPSSDGDDPKRGGGFGLIGNSLVSTYEWGPTKGRQTQSLRLGTSEYYLIASNGDNDNDLYLTTIHVENDDGTITNTIVDSWEIGPDAYMQSPGKYLCQVTGDIYAITYQHDTANNILKTFSVSSTTGIIQKTPIDTFTLSNRSCSQSMIRLTPTLFVIASQKIWNNLNTGYLETVYIDPSGNIGNSINDTQNFSTYVEGLVNPAIKLCSVDSNTIAIIYTGTGTDGYLVTYNISSIGDIQNTNASWYEFDTTLAVTPDIIRIASGNYAIVYSDSASDGWIKRVLITDSGIITKSMSETLEFDTADCWYPQISYCGNTSWNTYWYAITYRGTSGDGYITLVEITKSGYYISDLIIDTLEFDVLDCQWTPSLLFVNETYYLIIYPGADSSTDGSDGWAATINIYTNNQPPKITNPIPANQAITIDPNPSLTVTGYDPDKGGVDVTWSSNSTGPWIAFGKNNTGISPIRDQYEYDQQESRTPEIIHMGTSDYYLVAAAGDTGSDSDGFLRTYKAYNANGTIKKIEVDRWEYDDSDGVEPSIVQIAEDIYAIAYRDTTADRAKIFTARVWDENGTIQKSMIDVLSLSYDGSRSHLIKVTGDFYAVAYTEVGTGSVSATYDGFIETVQISSNGMISDTVLSTAEYDIADAYLPRLMMVDIDTILICYESTSYDGFIRTYNISSLGIFINVTTDLWEFDAADGYYPNVVKVGANRFAIIYRSIGRNYIRTIYIADTGMITKSFTDTLIFDYYGSGGYIRTTKILETNNQYLIVYASYPNTQLIACTVNISQDGIIDDDPVDKTRILDLGISLPNPVNIVPMGNGFYLLVIEGESNDGYLLTLRINPSNSDEVTQKNTNFNLCGNRYWWRVNVTDGKYISSQIFSFTTQYAPNANNDIFTVNEDTTTQFTVLANDNDPEGHPLTIITVEDPQHGTTSISGSTVTYIPDLNYHGPDLFAYTITDGHGGTDQASVSVTVNPVNDAPIAVDDIASVAEDTSNNQINVLTNDGDIDGDSLVITGVSTPSHGTATYTSSFVRYSPSMNYNGPDSFTYTISDGHGGTDTATVTITVTPVNDQPVANDDTATVNEDSTINQINVLANDGDIDNDPISVSGVTQPVHGAATFTISAVFYTPNPNYNGIDTFTYTIIDGYGGMDTATVTVTITPINDPPNAVDDTTTVAEDSSNNQINVRINDNDIDGDTLSITGVTTPVHGTATFTASYAFYSPSANYNGPDSFTYTISDGHGGTDTATVTVTVTPVNDPPVANDDAATVIEDSLNNNINVQANDLDIDGDPLSITSITQPIHGSSTFTASSVSYTPAVNYSGSDSFTYTISDGHGGTDPATVSVTITPVNDPPVAYNDTATVPEDSMNYPINVRANDIDVDGNILTIVSLTQPIHGIASTNGTMVFYTSSLNYFGSDSLTYTISDNNGGTDTAAIIITVTSVNDPPVAVNDAVTVAEDSTSNLINALANDFDIENNPLTIVSVTQPLHGVASTSTGFIFYSPAANYNGQDSFTYTISDGNGGTSIGTISITVTPMNDPPNANNDTATVAEDSSNNLINVLTNDNDPDGDSLSIASVSNPPHGSTTTNGNYVFYTPDLNYFGIDIFSYTMSDGHGGTDTATITVTVAPISDPPVASDDAITVPKDSSNNQLDVRANDYDPDNNPLTITSVTTPLHGSASTNGLYVFYTPTAGYIGPDTCSYTINDGTGNTDTAIISLTVAIINNPPNAYDDTATVVEDSTGNQLNVLSNDNDPNGDPIIIIGVIQPLHGTVSYTTTYVLYTPNPNYHGLDTFTYTISDGGSTDSARVNMTITSVNDPPVAADDIATVSEDSSNNQLNVQANDMDEDGDTLVITTVTTPAHGSVTFTALYVMYTPAQNYTGIDTFVYTIVDGHGGSDTATVTVTVTPINDPPTAIDDVTIVNEDSTANQLNVRTNDFDVDGDTLSIIAVTQPAHGSISFNANFISYTPASNYFGSDSFTYTINDGHGGSDSALVMITVLSINDPPVAGDDTVTVIEDSINNQLNVRANDNDIDGDVLSITAIVQPNHGSVTYTTQYVYYTPSADYFGLDTFSYTISDGNGGNDVATVSITITGINDPPIANDDTASVIEDSSGNQLNVRANDNDPDNNPLSIVSVSAPSHGTATFTSTHVYYTPQTNYAGSDSFSYTIADGQGGTDTGMVTVTITPVNDPPVSNDDTSSVTEDSTTNQINVRANDYDIDGDQITISSITQPTHGTASYNSSYVFYTPSANYNGFDALTYVIHDGHGSTDSATVTITVTPVNDPPTANDDSATVAEDSINNLINVLANDIDPDYNPLTVTSVTVPAHGTTSTNGVFIFYTPAPNYIGSDTFTYTISDAQGGIDSASVSIIITQVNDPPNAVDDSASVLEDSTTNQINVLLNDNDIDGNPLSVFAVTQPSHGLASFTALSVFYTPQSNYYGADQFVYTISDGQGGTDTALVTIMVTPLNDAPIANDDSIPVLEDSTNNQLNVLINDNDIDGDSLLITGITPPIYGSATFTASYVYYTPNADYNGPDYLTYVISDGHGGTDSAGIAITVTSLSDPPVAIDDSAIVIEDSSNNLINVLANDYDPENNPLLITSVTQPTHGTSSTNGAFVFYTPAPNYNGADSLSYTISDGGSTDSATIIISVTAANDPPSANDDTATIVEGSNNNPINVLLNDNDIDGNPLIIIGVTQPSHGSVTFSTTTVFYTPQANFVGGDSFTYTASDGLGGTDSALVTITVTNINDPPNAVDDTESVVEDSTNNQIEVLVNDYDIDGDFLTVTSITQPSHGSATFTTSNVYYTPSSNYNGPDSLSYTINDGHSGTDTATISLTVTSANDPPIAYDDTAIVDEDSTGNQLVVLSNDVDPENNPLFITSVTQPIHGTSSTNGAFVFYTPSPNYHGSDTFVYSISDGNGGTDSGAITISVSAINDAPNAIDDTATVVEDSLNNQINVLLNDNDIDGDTLTIVSVAQPSHGTTAFTSSTVSYTPVLNYFGPDSFTYSISDGHGGADTASVNVLITGVNDLPIAYDDTTTVQQGSSNNLITVRANDVDIDGDPLTVQSVTQPIHGSSSTDSLFVYYTPTPNYVGADSFTYTINDGHGGSDIASVFIMITNINDPPVANNDTVSVMEDSISNIFNVLLNDYDPDNNPLTIIGLTQPIYGIVSTNGIFVFYTPLPNYQGSDSFSYTISDGVFTDTATVFITVTSINDPPIVTNIPNQTIAEGSLFVPINLDTYVSDPDHSDAEMIWTYSGNVQLSVNIVNRVATITIPNSEWYGSETVIFRATDPDGLWDDDTVTFTVTAVNDPPIVTDISDQTILEGSLFTPINLDNYVSDPDHSDSEMTWTYSGNVQLSVSIVNHVATITVVNPTWYGTETITFKATDPGGLWDDDAATFIITPVDNSPIFGTPSPANGSIGNPYTFVWSIPINDPEGNSFNWNIQCSNGQSNSGTGASNGTKTVSVSGLVPLTSYMVWVNATDPLGSGLFTRRWYTFTTKENLPPVFGSPVPANGSLNQPLNLTWSIPINDPDTNLMNWSIQCSNGQSSSGTGASNGTKALFISGLAPFITYKVWVNATDPLGSGLFTRRWYTFTTKENLPPVFGSPVPANGSTNQPLTLTWSIPINDPEGNLFNWSIQCSNGQTNSSSGASNGTKTLSISGLVSSISYKVWVNATDPLNSGRFTRRWYMFSTGVNLPPVIGSPTPSNGSITNHLSFPWRIVIIDPDGDLFSWSIQCSNGQFASGSGASNGTKTLYVSGLAPLSSYVVWVNATDPYGAGFYARKWFTFSTGINLPPVFGEPVPANGSINTNLSFSWKIPINDPEGDLVSWSIQCSNGQSASGTGASNGTRSLPLSGLASLTSYTIWVNATDPPGINTFTRRWYTFSTEFNLPPVFGEPLPANGSMNNPLSLTWSIPIVDLEGDLLSWSIQCSNGQSTSGIGASNGTKTLSVSGLDYLTNYTVWVNASDPMGTSIVVREWYVFTTVEFINTPPGKPERPSGSMSGKINVNYTYWTSTVDVDGDTVWFWFEWGDGTNSGWVGPYDSDTIGSANHSWTAEGSFNITVKAKDIADAESNWSDPLLVSMPVEIDFTEHKNSNPVPVVQESKTNTIATQPAVSTSPSQLSDSATESVTDEPVTDESTVGPQEKNIFDFIGLIIRIFKGEYPEMNLLQIFKVEGWV